MDFFYFQLFMFFGLPLQNAINQIHLFILSFLQFIIFVHYIDYIRNFDDEDFQNYMNSLSWDFFMTSLKCIKNCLHNV